MNFYFEASKLLDRLDSKQGSVKSVLSSLPEKDRKRTGALLIETLKCEHTVPQDSHVLITSADRSALTEIIHASGLLIVERKKLTSLNLTLLLVHDLLLSNGIQAGDGPVKQAILRHKTRLHAEFGKLKIKRGVKANSELAASKDVDGAHKPVQTVNVFLISNRRNTSICPCQHDRLVLG